MLRSKECGDEGKSKELLEADSKSSKIPPDGSDAEDNCLCDIGSEDSSSYKNSEDSSGGRAQKTVELGAERPSSGTATSSSLNQVSEDEKSFACVACGDAFDSVSSLKAHIRVHMAEKYFKCQSTVTEGENESTSAPDVPQVEKEKQQSLNSEFRLFPKIAATKKPEFFGEFFRDSKYLLQWGEDLSCGAQKDVAKLYGAEDVTTMLLDDQLHLGVWDVL